VASGATTPPGKSLTAQSSYLVLLGSLAHYRGLGRRDNVFSGKPARCHDFIVLSRFYKLVLDGHAELLGYRLEFLHIGTRHWSVQAHPGIVAFIHRLH
jgi:hypothetical protein